MDIETELKDIQARISSATTKRARAQVEKENAEAELAKAKKQLKEEFGVSTNDEARALLTELTEQRDAAIEEIKISLEKSGV